MQEPKLVSDFLSNLGFNSEAIKLYISLVKSGPQTLLKLSRNCSVERTKLYRQIDELIEKGLIEEVPEHNRKIVKAADLNSIDLLVKQKQIQNKLLSDTLPAFNEAVHSISGLFPENNVVYYHGVEGIKQMTWHIIKCDDLLRTYSYRFWNEIFGDRFSLKLSTELLARNFIVHDLYSDAYIKFKNEWIESGHKKPEGNWEFWHSKYLDGQKININQNIDIYNDVVAYYYWQGEEIFGVEIHNKRVADLNKQIHDVLWTMAVKRPEISWTKDGLK